MIMECARPCTKAFVCRVLNRHLGISLKRSCKRLNRKHGKHENMIMNVERHMGLESSVSACADSLCVAKPGQARKRGCAHTSRDGCAECFPVEDCKKFNEQSCINLISRTATLCAATANAMAVLGANHPRTMYVLGASLRTLSWVCRMHLDSYESRKLYHQFRSLDILQACLNGTSFVSLIWFAHISMTYPSCRIGSYLGSI